MNSKIKMFVIISSLLLFPLTRIMAQDESISLNFTRIQWTYTQANAKVIQLEVNLAKAIKEKADADAKAVKLQNVMVSSYQTGGSSEANPKDENLKQVSAKVNQLQKELVIARKEEANADAALRKAKEGLKLNSVKK